MIEGQGPLDDRSLFTCCLLPNGGDWRGQVQPKLVSELDHFLWQSFTVSQLAAKGGEHRIAALSEQIAVAIR